MLTPRSRLASTNCRWRHGAVQLLAPGTAAGDYRLKIVVSATGGVTVYLARYVGTTETILATDVLASLTYAPGTSLSLRFQLTTVGASSTLKSMMWPTSTTAPTTFQLTTTDNTSVLQALGRIGLSLYVSKTVNKWPADVQRRRTARRLMHHRLTAGRRSGHPSVLPPSSPPSALTCISCRLGDERDDPPGRRRVGGSVARPSNRPRDRTGRPPARAGVSR